MPKISLADLIEWFHYNPETGAFTWRKRPEIGGGSAKVGDLAGSTNDRAGRRHPRRVLWLRGARIVASRAAYMMVHGDIPDNAMIDHADGDTMNDRIENLRLASAVQNIWNRARVGRLQTGASKGLRGRFKARIEMNGRRVNLGTWDTEAEAHAAYMGAAAVLHGEFWVGNREHAAAAIGSKRA